YVIFFFQAEDGIRDFHVTGVQTCALPIYQPDIRSMCAEYLYLVLPETAPPAHLPVAARRRHGFALERRFAIDEQLRQRMLQRLRSEERRVGKECRCRWYACRYQ